jgi:hypothetical protein
MHLKALATIRRVKLKTGMALGMVCDAAFGPGNRALRTTSEMSPLTQSRHTAASLKTSAPRALAFLRLSHFRTENRIPPPIKPGQAFS